MSDLLLLSCGHEGAEIRIVHHLVEDGWMQPGVPKDLANCNTWGDKLITGDTLSTLSRVTAGVTLGS